MIFNPAASAARYDPIDQLPACIEHYSMASGGAKLGWFRILKTSARNWAVNFSEMRFRGCP